MDPWAIMNTQEIWAQPSPPPSSTIVTDVMMVTTRVDSRATAGSKRLLGISDQAENVDARIELMWQNYGVHKPHRRQQMMSAALDIIRKYNENEGRGNEVGDHNYADTLVAVINTLAAKYQKCVQAKQSRIPNATVTPMATRRVDTCVTAQMSPSPPPLSASPASPSIDEHLARPMAISMQSNTTQTPTKTGRNEGKRGEKRRLGVSDETGQPVRGKPCPVVGKQGEWLTNYPLDPGKSPPRHPPSTIASFSTRFALLGGNHHPAPHSLTTGSTPELESSIRTHAECHTAQERLDEPFGLNSSPPESTERTSTPSRFRPTFLMEREGKWVVGGAQHLPLCLEGKRECKDDAIRIEKGQTGVSKVITHSLSELTHQTHPLPPSTCRTCFDASLRVENSPKPPLLRSSHHSSTISSKSMCFKTSGGNHLTPTHSTCFDVFLCVDNSPKRPPPLPNTSPPMLD